MTPTANAQHNRILAHAQRCRNDEEPTFYTLGAELDWMEHITDPTPIVAERREFLRGLRAGGGIAAEGELVPHPRYWSV